MGRRHGGILRSPLIDWCGQATAALRSLAERIKRSVSASDRLHADNTPIRVLGPTQKAQGKERGVKEGRVWTYVRDNRPSPIFSCRIAREAPSCLSHQLRGHSAGRRLFRVRDAACWALLRRAFHDVWKATGSEMAREALERIGALYDIERRINGRPVDVRLSVRQRQSRPRVDALHD
jgi:hypothetical protein